MPVKKTSKKLTATNTKQEMLDAYNSLMTEFENAQGSLQMPEEMIAARETKTAIDTADKLAAESIIKDISELKLKFGKALSEMSEKLEEEIQKYNSVRKAVEAKERELLEVFEIERAASSLSVLIDANNTKKLEFETDMNEQKAEFQAEMKEMKDDWEKDKIQRQIEQKERDAQEKKARDRQKEEFDYNFRLEQKQARDIFENEKAQLERQLASMKEEAEKNLASREKAITEKETELEMLRAKAAGYQKELDAALAKGIKDATEKIITENKYKESLLLKETEGERNVLTAKIIALETKIAEQAETIQSLGRQAEKSIGMVQDIAVKAVESAKVKFQQLAAENMKKD